MLLSTTRIIVSYLSLLKSLSPGVGGKSTFPTVAIGHQFGKAGMKAALTRSLIWFPASKTPMDSENKIF